MNKTHFNVRGMICAACSAHIEKAVKNVDGVNNVTISLLNNSMTVEYTDSVNESDICSAVEKAGYKASVSTSDSATPSNNTAFRLIISAILLLPLMYLSMGYTMLNLPLPRFLSGTNTIVILQLIISLAVIIINLNFFIGGFRSLFHLAPNMDTLVALGSSASFIYSVAVWLSGQNKPHLLHSLYFESAAMILTLITLGKLLEQKAKGKTTNAIKDLEALTPKTAHKLLNGEVISVSADTLKIGDIFIVYPGESIPADGIILEGESSVDESAFTGESMPVDKHKTLTVISGTVNGYGSLTCKTTAVGKSSSLGQIIKMIEESASSKAPIAKAADKVAGIFVPIVMAIASITFIVWMIINNNVGYSLARAVSVLVISCPCALGLATPVAIVVGSGTAAKKGILFKTAEALEGCGKADIIVFDKTGTLTVVKPQVTDIFSTKDTDIDYLKNIALSLEFKSEHPLAKAICQFLNNNTILDTNNFQALPGYGVTAVINGNRYFGGNYALMKNNGIDISVLKNTAENLSLEGKTPMFFSSEDKLLGIIAVADILKDDSVNSINILKNNGFITVLLTGDNKNTALSLGKKCGVEKIIAEVLPKEKATVIKKLKEYGKVIMVGDGINDAPALTEADIGIAIGSGTDIAINSADVVLINSNIRDVVTAISLSHSTLKNIYENLFWAFFYNCIGIPLAAGVFVPLGFTLNPMIGAAAMSLSSVCVVSNALRLNSFKHKNKFKRKNKSLIIPEIKIKGEANMNKTVLIDGMMCPKCVAHVEKSLSNIDGITSVIVSLENNNAVIESNVEINNDIIVSAITEAGYEVIDIK